MSKQKRKLKKNQVQVDGNVYNVGSPTYNQMYEDKFENGDVVWDNLLEEWVSVPKGMNDAWDELYKNQRVGKAQDKVRKGTGSFARPLLDAGLEMTGGAGAYRFAQDPLKNLQGTANVLSYANLPGLAMHGLDYMQGEPFFNVTSEDLEGLGNTFDVAGLATLGAAPLIKQGLKVAPKLLSSTSKAINKVPKVNVANINKTEFVTPGIDDLLQHIKYVNIDEKNRKIIQEGNKYFEELRKPESQKRLREFGNEYGIDLEDAYKKAEDRWDYNTNIGGHGRFKVKKTDDSWYGLSTTDLDIMDQIQIFDLERQFGKDSKQVKDFYKKLSQEKSVNYISDVVPLARYPKTIWHELSHDINKSIIDSSPKLQEDIKNIFIKKGTADLNKVKEGREYVAQDLYTKKDDVLKDLDNPKRLQEIGENEFDYVTRPTETWAFLSTNLRQDLKNTGLINDYNDLLTNEILEQASKNKNTTWSRFEPYIADKDKFIKLFNKMTLGVAPTAIATGAIGSQLMSQEESAPEQKAYGGKITNMKKNKLPKYQTGGPVDPNLSNRLMQYLFGRNTNKPSILDVRSPNEYGVSLGDRFNIQSGLSFDPMSGMPIGYGKVGINNKGFNLGLEKRKGQSTFNVGYDSPNFNIGATYSNTNKMPSIGGNVGFNTKGFNVGVSGNYSPDNKNIGANIGYNNKGFNAGLNYDYSGQSSLSGNVGYGNDLFNVGLSGNYSPGDANVNLNTTYNLGTRNKQKKEPIPLAFNTPEEIQLIKENAVIDSNEAAGPPKKSYGGKITNMKNNLPKMKWGGFAPQLFDLAANTLINGTTYAVTDMIKAIREPEQEMRPTKMNTGFVMENGGMIKRADGSYSQRGLWDNIRANSGSGKEPTKQMLEQEKKIKQKMAVGGTVDTGCPDGMVKDPITGECVYPYITSNPNDPRIKSYSDSTALYNNYVKNFNTIKSGGKYHSTAETTKPAKYSTSETWKDTNPNNPIVYKKIDNDFGFNVIGKQGYPDLTFMSNKKIQPITTETFTRKESQYPSVKSYEEYAKKNRTRPNATFSEKPNEARWVGYELQKYKAPVQPVVYKKPDVRVPIAEYTQQDLDNAIKQRREQEDLEAWNKWYAENPLPEPEPRMNDEMEITYYKPIDMPTKSPGLIPTNDPLSRKVYAGPGANTGRVKPIIPMPNQMWERGPGEERSLQEQYATDKQVIVNPEEFIKSRENTQKKGGISKKDKIKQKMAFGGMIDPSMYMQQLMYGSYANGGEINGPCPKGFIRVGNDCVPDPNMYGKVDNTYSDQNRQTDMYMNEMKRRFSNQAPEEKYINALTISQGRTNTMNPGDTIPIKQNNYTYFPDQEAFGKVPYIMNFPPVKGVIPTNQYINDYSPYKTPYANGGEVPQNIPVEVEGGEAYELPNGEMGEFEGPSHDNGGIPVALPEQTKVYSKQLKVNGKTMADRKTKREANVAKLEKILSKNPSDKFIKEALKRQQETAALEEQSDMAMQEQANQKQQMQQQPQQGMMQEQGMQQEQAMAGLMQDPAMMQQMGMMMYGGKLNKLQYGSPGTCPDGQYWNGTDCVDIPNSFASQSKFLNSADGKSMNTAFQKRDGVWKGITIGKGNQIPHEGFKDYNFTGEGNPFYRFGSSLKHNKDRILNFPEQINIAYDDLGVPVTDEKIISELNTTLNEPSYLTKNRSEAEYYEGLTAMQPMLQLMNPFINQNKNNYTAPTTTSNPNPDPYDVMNNLLFAALKNPSAFGAKMGSMPMDLKENNPDPNAPKTETTKPNVTDTNPPSINQNPNKFPSDVEGTPNAVEINRAFRKGGSGKVDPPGVNPYDAMNKILEQTFQNIAISKDPYINTKGGMIPNPFYNEVIGNKMLKEEKEKKPNKFMNFLNKAVDETGDFFTGLFDRNGKPKKEKGAKKGSEKIDNNLPYTAGDYMGMAGTKFGALAPMTTTMLNRMMTPKNQNFFREYGAEGLRAMQEAQALSAINRDKQLADIKLGEETSRQRGRNSARGVNTLRAMDISSDIAANQAQNQAYNSYAQQMMQLLGQKGQMENQQDQMVMQGEYNRDLADRQDVDQFYTNLAENFASQSELMQKQGRDMNQAQYNKMILEMSPMFSKYGIGVSIGENGKIAYTWRGEKVDETTARLKMQEELKKEAEQKKAGTTTPTTTTTAPVNSNVLPAINPLGLGNTPYFNPMFKDLNIPTVTDKSLTKAANKRR